MANDKNPRYRLLTVSGRVSRGPCLFYGISIESDSLRETSEVYAGPDENELQHFYSYVNIAKGSEDHWLPEPVRFDQGLYVKLGTNVDSILVLFEDLPT